MKKMISATIDTETIKQVKALAKKEHRSFSSMVDVLLMRALEKEKK